MLLTTFGGLFLTSQLLACIASCCVFIDTIVSIIFGFLSASTGIAAGIVIIIYATRERKFHHIPA